VNVWKVILVTLVIFSAGAITGSLVTRQALLNVEPFAEHHSTTNRHGPGRPERMMRMEFLTRAETQLDLTPEQIIQIEEIVQDGQARTRTLWEEVSPRMREEFKTTQDRIREVLTPIQRDRFEELLKKRMGPRRGDRDRGDGEAMKPPPPPPPPNTP
jgi:Spy/CpxP family protein refolding chaperone